MHQVYNYDNNIINKLDIKKLLHSLNKEKKKKEKRKEIILLPCMLASTNKHIFRYIFTKYLRVEKNIYSIIS